jgi:hypothetical protein
MSFSTATLPFDAFSSLITSSTRITAELYPTFQFDTMTTGALTSKSFPMQTLVQYSTIWLSTSHETRVPGVLAQDGYSNFFQQPIKISIPGTQVLGSYVHPYRLYHYMEGALSYNTNVGFRDSNLNVFFASTNSVFLSVQNLTF